MFWWGLSHCPLEIPPGLAITRDMVLVKISGHFQSERESDPSSWELLLKGNSVNVRNLRCTL
jgi:hypothetical protein